MQLVPAVILSLLLTVLSLGPASTNAHNITKILAKLPEFSTFNHYLTVTHLAGEINRRRTITVCVVDNAGMSDLLAKHLSLPTIKNVLSLHVFSDYFGSKKLHQLTGRSELTSSLFQASGSATGTSGYVNITDLKGGKVGFGPEDNGGEFHSVFVKSVEELPYVIAVLQISHVISSPDAEAPAAGPGDMNLTSLMAKQGCKAFSDLLVANLDAEDAFNSNIEGGLTAFCPTDSALSAFMPRFKNLSAAGKVSLLLFHGVPVYHSLGMLRSSNGPMNTLATEGANKYDFRVQNDGEDVKVVTKIVTANIIGTLIDADPVAVFKVDKVLLPRELFKAAPPAPAPKPSGHPKKKGQKEAADAPGPGSDDGQDDDDVADQRANDNGSGRVIGGWLFITVAVGLATLAFA